MPSRRYTEAEFRAAVENPAVRTISDLCRALGIVPRGGNYENVRRYARQLGINLAAHVELPDRRPERPHQRWLFTDEDFLAAVAASRSIAETIRRLGGRPGGAAYHRVRLELLRLQPDTSHWLGQGWARGRTFLRRRIPIEQYLVPEPTSISTWKLRRRLVEEGILEPRCAMCGNDRWLDGPIPLELDHIDGDRWNNELANLRVLCPNCHALTPPYRGRNIGRRSQT
jgi:hypothetical protein